MSITLVPPFDVETEFRILRERLENLEGVVYREPALRGCATTRSVASLPGEMDTPITPIAEWGDGVRKTSESKIEQPHGIAPSLGVEKSPSVLRSPSDLNPSEILEAAEDIELEESLWDVGIMMFVDGEEAFTKAEKLIALMLVVVNYALQIVFLVAVFTTMSGDPYDTDTLETVLTQRLMENHKLDLIDSSSHQTRAKLLCDGLIHNRLAGTYNEVAEYLQAGDRRGIPGEIISLIAMYIWVLSMMTELRRAVDVAFAVLSLPSPNGKSVLKYDDDNIQGGVICSMTIQGKLSLVLTQVLPRLGIAGLLTFGGQYFLASSTSVADLVLNACALEIVKDLDELLYAALMTKHSRQVVAGTAIRPNNNYLGGWLSTEVYRKSTNAHAFTSAQVNMVIRFFMSIGLVLAGWFLYLKPTVDHTVIADHNICGNVLNFAFADHPSGLPMFTVVDESDHSTAGLQCYFDAYKDMVRMRAGFGPLISEWNSTLIDLVSGSSSMCQEPGSPNPDPDKLDCPAAKYAIVADEMAETDILTSGFCRDRDVAFLVLRTTCLAKPRYAELTPMVSLFATRASCSAISDLCDCPDPCSPGSLPTIDGIELDFDLFKKIQTICPSSCGQCKSVGGTGNTGVSNASNTNSSQSPSSNSSNTPSSPPSSPPSSSPSPASTSPSPSPSPSPAPPSSPPSSPPGPGPPGPR